MKDILQIHIVEIDGQKAVDILRNGYNIIQETIYDDEIATQILEIINANRQTDPNEEF